jgi:DNA-binding transcriptional regulator YiaG
MGARREDKLTLRSYKGPGGAAPLGQHEDHRETREPLNFSRPVFARKLHINERTLEKWESGAPRPNPQAATLLLLVR